MGVGMPQGILLQQFGEHIYRAFGHRAYHVGSSLTEKSGWRGVDVRMIVPDVEFERMFGDPCEPGHMQRNKRWVSTVLAWSIFGRELTGLPIDFQIQQASHASETEGEKPRSALICICELDWSAWSKKDLAGGVGIGFSPAMVSPASQPERKACQESGRNWAGLKR